MNFLKKLTAIVLVLSMSVLLSSACLKPVKPLLPEGTKIKRSSAVQAVMMNTISSNDFPYTKNLLNSEMQNYVQNTIKHLHEIGINTIFYEAVNEFQSMCFIKSCPESSFLRTEKNVKYRTDPLKLIKQQADQYGIDVYVVINPYKIGDTSKINLLKEKYKILNDNVFIYDDEAYFLPNEDVMKYAADMSKEFVKKYQVEGIVLKEFELEPYSQFQKMNDFWIKQFSYIKNEIESVKSDAIVGAIFGDSAENHEIYQSIALNLLENMAIDMVIPKVNQTTDEGYEKTVKDWYKIVSKYSVPMITINNAYRIFAPTGENSFCGNRFELNYQAIINENMGIHGVIIDDYTSLVNKFTDIQNSLSTLFVSDIKTTDYDYKINNKLKVNFVKSGVVNTDKNYVYVTGTCNPKKPLFLNNKKIDNVMPNGIFGINLPVKNDVNIFMFRQGNSYSTIRIYKEGKVSIDYDKKISSIVPETTYPNKSEMIDSGHIITLSCVAPSGSTVTATLQKHSIVLEQTDEVEEGLPALFEGYMTINDEIPLLSVTDMGKISYAMTYNGKINVSRSQGNLFIAGARAEKAVKVDDYMAYVYSSPNEKSPSLYTMKMGATDYVIGDTEDFYELKSGGFIKKNSVKIISGTPRIDASYTSYTTENDPKGETVNIMGNNAANIKSKMTDHSIIFTFYNTKTLPDIIPSNTQQFKNIIKLKIDEDTYQLQFIFKDDVAPWGYNYKYYGENYQNLKIYFKFKPKLSEKTAKPLENVLVYIDPACVDTEFDTLDIMENYGLHEAEINLNIALKTKELLEAMGANVVLSRYDNKYLDNLERMTSATQSNADFFISIAHNHIKNNEDRLNVYGSTVEYSNKSWQDFADVLTNSMKVSTGRRINEPMEKEDLVMQITSCPAVTLKNGYLSNPKEYNKILEPISTYKTASAIANAILDMLI